MHGSSGCNEIQEDVGLEQEGGLLELFGRNFQIQVKSN